VKISKHKSGLLYTTLTIRGNKKFIFGETADEVEAKYTELKYKHRQGYNITDNPTLKEYMIDWYTAFKKGKGAIKTQKMYQNCINNHINPVLGKQKVKSITSTQVQNFLNNIDGSKSLVHKVRITLNQIFKQAMADRIISFNPVAGTKIIAPDEPKRKFLTPFQRELMLEILKEHRAYPLVFAILHTGMRMGEALALTWNDIDFENKIIKVSKAFEFERSKPKLKQPKTELLENLQ
jgi:integrase